jgi:glycosyltransferase involved in cell wall biosynthesis
VWRRKVMDVNVLAPANQLGYGVAGLNFLINLRRLGHRVSYFPIGNPDVPLHYHEALKEMVENAKMFDPDSPCLRIWHQNDMAQRVGYGKLYGMPIFELDTFSEVEKHHLSTLDRVIVNSEWAKKIVIDQTDQSEQFVKVVPLGVDREIFCPTDSQQPKHTIFLNMGKWEIRKGHDILIKAFERAFNKDDNVLLWMCCENPFYDEAKNKEWADYYLNSKLGSKVRVLSRQETQQDVARLMNMSDCGVFPSRGEGWNLELLEMMSCGKQVIATNYSAHTEFCNEHNCFLVGEDFEVEPAYDGVWFHGQGNWAAITEDHIDEIATHMTKIHENKQNNDNMPNHEGIKTAIEYSWENSTKKLIEAMS